MNFKIKIKAIEQPGPADKVGLYYKWPRWFPPRYKQAIIATLMGDPDQAAYVSEWQINNTVEVTNSANVLERSCALLDLAYTVYEKKQAEEKQRDENYRNYKKALKKAERTAKVYAREDCD